MKENHFLFVALSTFKNTTGTLPQVALADFLGRLLEFRRKQSDIRVKLLKLKTKYEKLRAKYGHDSMMKDEQMCANYGGLKGKLEIHNLKIHLKRNLEVHHLNY